MEKIYSLEEKIDIIRQAILKYVPAKYIYLFGSHAYGTPSADSDIDIYAVIPDELGNDPYLRGNILWDLGEFDIYEVDLHIKSESKFNYKKTQSLFEGAINEKGKIIYELA